jgi:hypothetical protein
MGITAVMAFVVESYTADLVAVFTVSIESVFGTGPFIYVIFVYLKGHEIIASKKVYHLI